VFVVHYTGLNCSDELVHSCSLGTADFWFTLYFRISDPCWFTRFFWISGYYRFTPDVWIALMGWFTFFTVESIISAFSIFDADFSTLL